MKGASFRYGLLVLACLLAAPVGAAEDEGVSLTATGRDRVWENFNREAAVVGDGKIRLAVRGMIFNKAGAIQNKLDLIGFPLVDFEKREAAQVETISGGMFDLVGSYGLGKNAELGLHIPFFMEQIEFEREDKSTINTGDIGDMVLYGKFTREVREKTVIGAGLELSIPTGTERKRLGTGELGFNPFISARYTYRRLAAGGHLGYYIYTGTVPDVFNWSTQFLVLGSDKFTIRCEISGRFFKDFSQDWNDIAILPGLDFFLSENLIIRPQALVGLTTDAQPWGVGAALVYTL